MAPRLPRELVTLVIRELFIEAKQHQAADVSSFKALRLVARHVKADAHQAWPGGLYLLAVKACARLLSSSLTPAAFEQGLCQARLVLEETTSLHLGVSRYGSGSEVMGDAEYQQAFACAKQIVASTRALGRLSMTCPGAQLALRHLPLSHLRLKELLLWSISRESLVGLDLSEMHSLEELEIRQSAVGAADLTGFRLPPKVSVIKCMWMSLSSDQVEILGLERISGLRALDLSGSRLDRPLPAMPALRALHLYSARVDHQILASLASWSTLKELTLKELDLASTSITSVAPLALATNTSLKRLDVSGTGIQDAATFELKTNTGLCELKAEACHFTSLAFGLGSNHSLRELSLGGSRLTVPLMQQMTGELSTNSALAKLDLSHCFLTDEMMVYFRLEKTSGLEELALSFNSHLTAEGLRPLGDSATEHGLLRKLDLFGCMKVTAPFVARLRTPSRIVLFHL